MLSKIKSCIFYPFITKTIEFLETKLMHLLMLFIRFWIARVFWYSGLTKISNWEGTIFLFKDEYKVPVINPEIAAYLSTSVELACPILLITGFMSRLSAIPLICMTMVIQLTYDNSVEHIYWMTLLATILLYGPGKISLDYIIKNKLSNMKAE